MAIRGCAECGQRDEFPRHVVGLTNVAADTSPPTPRHLDCCAGTGCPQCTETMRVAGPITGQALADHLAALRSTS